MNSFLHVYFLTHNMEACSIHGQEQSRDIRELLPPGAILLLKTVQRFSAVLNQIQSLCSLNKIQTYYQILENVYNMVPSPAFDLNSHILLSMHSSSCSGLLDVYEHIKPITASRPLLAITCSGNTLPLALI